MKTKGHLPPTGGNPAMRSESQHSHAKREAPKIAASRLSQGGTTPEPQLLPTFFLPLPLKHCSLSKTQSKFVPVNLGIDPPQHPASGPRSVPVGCPESPDRQLSQPPTPQTHSALSLFAGAPHQPPETTRNFSQNTEATGSRNKARKWRRSL